MDFLGSQLEVIFKTIAEAIFVQDRNYRCVYANDLAAQKCGFRNAEEFKNASLDTMIQQFEVYDENRNPLPKEKLTARRALAGEDPAEGIYLYFIKETGEDRIIKSVSRPIRNEGGEIEYAVTIFRDITDERRAEQDAQFLADASKIFASSLDLKETISSLGDVVVPRLADWYGIELPNANGILETIHGQHRDPKKLDVALRMRRKYPDQPQETQGTYNVFRTGVPEVYNHISVEEQRAHASTAEHLEMLKITDIHAAMIVPLKVGDRVIGVMNLCQSESKRKFTPADEKLAVELAYRAALAIENAKLYSSIEDERQKLKLAIEAAKLGVFSWDIRSGNLYWSDRTCEIFGYAPAEFTGSYEQYINRLHPEDRESSKTLVRNALQAKQDYSLEHRILLPSGEVRWILGNGHPTYDQQGNPIRVSGTVKDVTWRKEAEIYQTKLMQFQQIATLLPNIETAKEIAETLINESLSHLGAVAGAVYLTPQTNRPRLIYDSNVDTIDSKSPPHLEQCIQSGTRVIADSTIAGELSRAYFPLISHGECIGVLEYRFAKPHSLTDILLGYAEMLADRAAQAFDRALTFKEAQDSKRRADRANQAKSAFLANMSHEIRTPMNAILGFSKLLKEADLSETEREELLQRIEVNSDHLMHLIDDILDLSRIEAGQMRIESKPISLQELVTDVYESLNLLVAGKSIQTRIEMDAEIPEFVLSDYVRLKQVLINLIGNSVKFTDSGHITLRARLDEFAEHFTIEIEDSGVGIDKSIQRKLFRPFSQGDASITRRYGGTGLGLALSRKICEALGGSLILVRSEMGQGSLFRVKIPLFQVPEAVKAESHQRRPTTSAPLAQMRILLAEDSVDNRDLIKMYLRNTDCVLEVAEDGRQAVQKANEQPYDLVLMDVQMPNLDGLQATKELRSRGFKKPIIALTAHALPEEVKRSLDAGCNSHLTKPVSKTTLINEIVRFYPQS